MLATSREYVVAGVTFKVDPRYRDLRGIGKGSYGVVCSAFDQTTKKRVAIKKITPMAAHEVDAKHVLREIRLMRYLGVHRNVVTLHDVFINEKADELYIVMELLDSDMHRIIQSQQPLSDAHHRYFMYQLLEGIRFLHNHGIIHRDLKPGNLLVTKNCELRITDFGLARAKPTASDSDDPRDRKMTEHVVTRWYRPPELMLSNDGLYTYAVDMWSIGCIFAEMIGRRVLFEGKHFVHQLTLIFDVIGSPDPREIAHIRNPQALQFLNGVMGRAKVPFEIIFPDATPQAVSLLEGLLVFDPKKRLTVEEALAHEYFDPLRGWKTGPEPELSEAFEFEFENRKLTRLQLKHLIIQEVESFRREAAANRRARREDDTVSMTSPVRSSLRTYSSSSRPVESSPVSKTRTTRVDVMPQDPADEKETPDDSLGKKHPEKMGENDPYACNHKANSKKTLRDEDIEKLGESIKETVRVSRSSIRFNDDRLRKTRSDGELGPKKGERRENYEGEAREKGTAFEQIRTGLNPVNSSAWKAVFASSTNRNRHTDKRVVSKEVPTPSKSIAGKRDGVRDMDDDSVNIIKKYLHRGSSANGHGSGNRTNHGPVHDHGRPTSRKKLTVPKSPNFSRRRE